jgi:hypothetical protein
MMMTVDEMLSYGAISSLFVVLAWMVLRELDEVESGGRWWWWVLGIAGVWALVAVATR